MLEHYKTLAQAGTHDITIKGSQFICHLQRAHTEEEALQFIQRIKKEHWKATHNCAAFQIGPHHSIQRAFDDGEPSGTAGVPMLEVLKKNDLHDVVAVVTRYFGGTKLGSGGLIRAYTQAVSDALQTLGIVLCSLETIVSITIDYTAVGKLEYFLQSNHYTIIQTEYSDKVVVHCSIATSDLLTFQQLVIDLLNNQVTFDTLGEQYIERPIS